METSMTIPKTKQDIQISSRKQFYLTNYKPAKLIASSNIKNYDEVFQSKDDSIAKIKRELGDSFTKGYIKIWLIELNELLNLRRPMTESQITFSAQLIVDEFFNLKISDLTLLFRKILSGQYGELYESLNPPKILGFFRNYLNERTAIAAEYSMQQHLKHKQ